MSIQYGAESDRLEAWLIKNSTWVALAIIAAAFAIRMVYAGSCYLNPDEAEHFGAARSGSWLEAYKASLMLAHPPLFILVLHGILFLGATELILRLPSLVAGTAALWLAFAWMRRSLEGIAALAGLGFLALSPAAITAATEVRQYGLLLLFVCGSLYATQRTFAERSTTWAVVQGLFLLGALLTNYTAVVVLVALGLYVSLRLASPSWLKGGAPQGILIAITASQLVLATLLGCLYLGHIRRSAVFTSIGSLDYLQRYYYAAGHEGALGFVWRAVSGTFYYAVGPRPLAILLLLVFVAGVAALLAGRTRAPGITGLLVISPFVVGLAAAAFRVFPFAGSRHQAYLLPFLALGISAAVAWLPRGWTVPLLLMGLVVAPVWIAHSAPENDPRVLPRFAMTETIDYLGRTVPRGEPLFVDDVTLDDLRYYLARNDTRLDEWSSSAGVEERLDGYLVVVPRMRSQIAFRPVEMVEDVTDSARALGLPPGDPLWVVCAAWKEPSLGSRLPLGADHEVKEFGRISVIRVTQKPHSLM